MERSEIPHEPRHLGVPSGASKMISDSMERSAQTVHPPCVNIYHYLQTDRNELSVEPRHLVVPSGASKMIHEPMVHLAQTMHLSCTDANTVSKENEVIFHMTHAT